MAAVYFDFIVDKFEVYQTEVKYLIFDLIRKIDMKKKESYQ